MASTDSNQTADIARLAELVRSAREALWLTPSVAAEKLDLAEALLNKLNNDAAQDNG